MTLYAFRARYPVKAAEDLRKAGYDAFTLCILDRRKVQRNVRKTTASKVVLAPGMAGYVFAHDPDPWKVSKIPRLHPVRRADGRWQAATAAEAQWLMNPPAGLFHDLDASKQVARQTPPDVKAGDCVKFQLACQMVDAEVLSTDGHTLTLRLRIAMLGRDVVQMPAALIEAA